MEDMSEAKNGDQEEICQNSNILTSQKEKHQHCIPEVPINENWSSTIGTTTCKEKHQHCIPEVPFAENYS